MKLRVLITSLFLLGLFISFQSCKTTQGTVVENSDLDGQWVLKSMNGENAASIFKGKIPTLTFDVKKWSLFGNGGCNRYNGAFSLVKGKLLAPNIASTMMMCTEANSEGLFLQALSNSPELFLNKGILTFKQNGKVVLEFEKAKPLTVKDLSGEWILQSIEGATANVHFKDKIPTMNFNAETGRIAGNSGCNTYSAAFEFKGAQIEIKPMITTRMACSDGMEGEAKFTQLLTGLSDIELENGLLTLKRDGRHVASFVKK